MSVDGSWGIEESTLILTPVQADHTGEGQSLLISTSSWKRDN